MYTIHSVTLKRKRNKQKKTRLQWLRRYRMDNTSSLPEVVSFYCDLAHRDKE